MSPSILSLESDDTLSHPMAARSSADDVIAMEEGRTTEKTTATEQTPGTDDAPRKPIESTASPDCGAYDIASIHLNPDIHYRLIARIEHACLNLSPSFFSLNMGTGIVSILLHNLPYNASWLRRLSIVIFILNIVLFAVFSVASVVRYARWKGLFAALATHTVAGMYWGCLPMGLVTIINMVALVCVPAWGYKWALVALALWWIDVVLAITVNFGSLVMMFSRQTHTSQTISSLMILPIVSSVVAASSGGVVAHALSPFDPTLARSTVICSFIIWGTGVPMALFIITIWMNRTLLHGLPGKSTLPSLFLPLGPCGQGSFGIVLLGSVVRNLSYTYNVSFAIAPLGAEAVNHVVADAIYAGCVVTGLVLWGLALVWYSLAMVLTLVHLGRGGYFARSGFTVGWTAYTFPIGVWATATTQLAAELDSPALRVIGTIISLQVAMQWAYVFGMTVWKAWDGTIFVAPELSKWEGGRPPLRWVKVGEEEKGRL